MGLAPDPSQVPRACPYSWFRSRGRAGGSYRSRERDKRPFPIRLASTLIAWAPRAGGSGSCWGWRRPMRAKIGPIFLICCWLFSWADDLSPRVAAAVNPDGTTPTDPEIILIAVRYKQ